MNDLNHVSIIGRLVRDPELKYTPGGTAICIFDLANNRTYMKNGEKIEQVSFFRVQCWAHLAEVVNQYLQKGSLVGISGQLQQQRWQNDAGENRSKVLINARSVQFLSRTNNVNSSPEYTGEPIPSRPSQDSNEEENGLFDGEEKYASEDDDIPF